MEQMRKFRPHVFHFFGHGNSDLGTGEGGLAFEDDNAKAIWVSGRELSNQINTDSLRLVVLMASDSARMELTEPLLKAGIPNVIAMQFPITVNSAATFEKEFYSSLFEGTPIDEAVAYGRRRVFESSDLRSWAAVVFYSTSPQSQQLIRRRVLAEPMRRRERVPDLSDENAPEEAFSAADQAVQLDPIRPQEELLRESPPQELKHPEDAQDAVGAAQQAQTANGTSVESGGEESLGGGYDADDADNPARKDALGFNDDVKMLCSILADKDARPPLSVGLFGEWGSGKSFFMRLMRQRIEKLAEAAYEAEIDNKETRYCSHVVQITFNAWHYMDANLWASLAVEVFNRLAEPPPPGLAARTSVEEERARVEDERKRVLRRLDSYQRLVADLTEARQRAEQERVRVEKELCEAIQERESIAWKLAAVVAEDAFEELEKDPELTELRERTAKTLGMSELPPSELPGLVNDLRKLAGQAGVTWRLLAKRKGTWTFGLAVVFVVALLVGLVLLASRGSQVPGAASIAIALATMTGVVARIRPVVTAVNDGLAAAESALRRAETIEQKFRERRTKKQVELEAKLKGLLAQEQSLTVQVAEATAKEAEARAEEEDLRAGRRLRRFLQERSGSSDYRSHLGLISLLHQDLQQLSNLLQLAQDDKNDEKSDDRLPRIDRIVLYVDDLDRCPPSRVVEVLQAMHLLLALPLFVVVVGVDPRWLLRSLQRHYRALLSGVTAERAESGDVSHWASTPQNYLEKIFQIPFALASMTGVGFARLVDDLAVGTADQLSTDAKIVADDHRDDSAVAMAGSSDASAGVTTPDLEAQRPESRISEATDNMDKDVSQSDNERDGDASSGDAPDFTVPPDVGRPSENGPVNVGLPLAEEQRIFVEPSSAASPDEHIDPNPSGLTLTDHEIRFIQALAPLVTTPRAGKRLVNIYRMIRSTQATGGSSRFLDVKTGQGDYKAILQLLAIVSGFPHLTAAAFAMLLETEAATSWSAFVDALSPEPGTPHSIRERHSKSEAAEWRRLQAGLIAVRNDVDVPMPLSPYLEWAPRVSRFSFAAGRLLGETVTARSATASSDSR